MKIELQQARPAPAPERPERNPSRMRRIDHKARQQRHQHEQGDEGPYQLADRAEKHAAARQVAEHVKSVLRQSVTTIDREARELDREADEILAKRFDPSAYSQYSLSETVRWIREQAKRETGLLEIKKQAGINNRVATVLYDLDDILLDLTPEVHAGFLEASISKLAPEAATKIATSGQLRKLSANYAKAITGVDRSYYMPAIANQVDTRVEV